MKIKMISLALAALMLAASLTACGDKGDSAETGDGSSADTSVGTSAETELPRHDYMGANVAADVTIDRKDYTGLTLTVSNSLKVEEADVAAYVEKQADDPAIDRIVVASPYTKLCLAKYTALKVETLEEAVLAAL